MPCYNAEMTLMDAIDSVKKQTVTEWELLIADDCSSDHSRDILSAEAACDVRIRPLFLEKNGGAATARNAALAAAKGRYIAFLDSDDRWKPEKLQRQLAFMRANNYAFTFSGYDYIDKAGRPIGRHIHAPKEVHYEDMLKNTVVGCLTVMIDRAHTGDFQMPPLRSRQDLATWLALLKRGFVAYGLDENLADYRITGSRSLSGNKWRAAQHTWNVYRQVEHLPLLRSVWYFGHYAFHAMGRRFGHRMGEGETR
ncbi:MAG: glycosyltransferase [Sporolactobacillus sp.]